MDNSNIQRLVDQVNNDVALQGRFKSISDTADFDALVSELGYDITYADFAEAAQDIELSDTELADVAGGGEPLHDLGVRFAMQRDIARRW